MIERLEARFDEEYCEDDEEEENVEEENAHQYSYSNRPGSKFSQEEFTTLLSYLPNLKALDIPKSAFRILGDIDS